MGLAEGGGCAGDGGEDAFEWEAGRGWVCQFVYLRVVGSVLRRGEMLWRNVMKQGRGTYRWPMTPVLMTKLLGPSSPLAALVPRPFSASSDAFPIALASSSPPRPVTAFAHPEFTTKPLIPAPFRFCKTSLVTVTGAAWNRFCVNTAAAEQGLSDAKRAMSSKRVLEGLTPAWAVPALKPCG